MPKPGSIGNNNALAAMMIGKLESPLRLEQSTKKRASEGASPGEGGGRRGRETGRAGRRPRTGGQAEAAAVSRRSR